MDDNAEVKIYFFFLANQKNHFSLNSYKGDCQMHLFYDFGTKNEISNFEASLWWVFPKNWEPLINISWLKNEQVKVCFFTLESPYPYFCCNLRHNVMPYMYSEMQNKLSKTRESPLESMGQIISSQCPGTGNQLLSTYPMSQNL